MSRITITKPDDWHIHLRDGDMLERTVNDVAAWANRAVVMPNRRRRSKMYLTQRPTTAESWLQ